MTVNRLTLTVATLALALTASSCSTASLPLPATGRPVARGDCGIVAEIAVQLGGDNFDPKVAGQNCRDAFEDAGLPMLGLRKPGDPDTAPGLPHILQFEAPEHLDDGNVRLRVNFTCPRLCGHGEEVIAQAQASRWVIVSRKMTWIS